MKTSTFSIMITCIVACASLLLWSCNKDGENLTISVASEDVDAFYAASVLKSKSIEELPENISKEEIANMALKLAKEKYKTDDVIITDLYVYPDVDGVEFFYKLPSGLETNALFIDIKNIEDIAIESEQFEIASDNYDSHLTLDGNSAVLKTKDMLNN